MEHPWNTSKKMNSRKSETKRPELTEISQNPEKQICNKEVFRVPWNIFIFHIEEGKVKGQTTFSKFFLV